MLRDGRGHGRQPMRRTGSGRSRREQDRAAFAALFEFYAPRIKAMLMRLGRGGRCGRRFGAGDAAHGVAQGGLFRSGIAPAPRPGFSRSRAICASTGCAATTGRNFTRRTKWSSPRSRNVPTARSTPRNATQRVRAALEELPQEQVRVVAAFVLRRPRPWRYRSAARSAAGHGQIARPRLPWRACAICSVTCHDHHASSKRRHFGGFRVRHPRRGARHRGRRRICRFARNAAAPCMPSKRSAAPCSSDVEPAAHVGRRLAARHGGARAARHGRAGDPRRGRRGRSAGAAVALCAGAVALDRARRAMAAGRCRVGRGRARLYAEGRARNEIAAPPAHRHGMDLRVRRRVQPRSRPLRAPATSTKPTRASSTIRWWTRRAAAFVWWRCKAISSCKAGSAGSFSRSCASDRERP